MSAGLSDGGGDVRLMVRGADAELLVGLGPSATLHVPCDRRLVGPNDVHAGGVAHVLAHPILALAGESAHVQRAVLPGAGQRGRGAEVGQRGDAVADDVLSGGAVDSHDICSSRSGGPGACRWSLLFQVRWWVSSPRVDQIFLRVRQKRKRNTNYELREKNTDTVKDISSAERRKSKGEMPMRQRERREEGMAKRNTKREGKKGPNTKGQITNGLMECRGLKTHIENEKGLREKGGG